MEAGKKDQPVYFEAPTRSNVGGVVTTTWADGAGNSPAEPDWCFVISQRGKEAFEAGRTQAVGIIRLCCNYRADVLTTWRVKWLDQYYQIVDVDRSQARRGELWITAQLMGAS